MWSATSASVILDPVEEPGHTLVLKAVPRGLSPPQDPKPEGSEPVSHVFRHWLFTTGSRDALHSLNHVVGILTC